MMIMTALRILVCIYGKYTGNMMILLVLRVFHKFPPEMELIPDTLMEVV